jgi:hypothetical protein
MRKRAVTLLAVSLLLGSAGSAFAHTASSSKSEHLVTGFANNDDDDHRDTLERLLEGTDDAVADFLESFLDRFDND